MGKAGPAEEVCAAAAPTGVEPVTFGLGSLKTQRPGQSTGQRIH